MKYDHMRLNILGHLKGSQAACIDEELFDGITEEQLIGLIQDLWGRTKTQATKRVRSHLKNLEEIQGCIITKNAHGVLNIHLPARILMRLL